MDRHDLESYVTEPDSGLVAVSCSCGWTSPPVETVHKGIEEWTAHANGAGGSQVG